MFKNKLSNKITKHPYLAIFIVSMIITAFALLPIFKSGLYAGHDIFFQLSRLDGVITAIQDQQFPLALYPNKNFGFGYPSPQFYSDLFLIIPAIVRYVFNIPFITFYKVLLFSLVLFTNFSIIYCANKISKKLFTSFFVAFLFSFSNYYQTDIFIRSALGEIIAFAIIPWILYFTYQFIYEDKNNSIALGISFSAVLYAHNISFLLCVIAFGILLLLNFKKIFLNKDKIFQLIKAMAIGLLMAASFLFPMLQQYNAQTLVVHEIGNELLQNNAIKLNQLLNDFITQFSFSYNNTNGILNVDKTKSLGIILTILPIVLYFLNKNKTKPLKDYFVLFIILLLFSTNLIPLYKIDLLSFLQFPSRMYLIVSIVACLIISMSYSNKLLNKYIIILICIFSIWNISYLHINLISNKDLVIIPENTTSKEMFIDRIFAKEDPSGSTVNFEEVENAEYLPFNWNFNYQTASKCIVFENGTEKICNYERHGSHFDFYTNYEEDYKIMLPITWYLGYTAAEVDENYNIIKTINLFKDQSSNRVMMQVEKGEHHYKVWYSGTRIQKISTTISILTSSIIIIYFIKKKHFY